MSDTTLSPAECVIHGIKVEFSVESKDEIVLGNIKSRIAPHGIKGIYCSTSIKPDGSQKLEVTIGPLSDPAVRQHIAGVISHEPLLKLRVVEPNPKP